MRAVAFGLGIAAVVFGLHAQPRLIVSGPRVVPDTTTYEYRSNCPVDADWTIRALGSPATAKGKNLVVTWGATQGKTEIDVVCRAQRSTLPVEVVEVKIDKTTVQFGGQASPRDDGTLKLVDTSGSPPAIKFRAALTVTGPRNSPHWGGKIATGFVQRLVDANAAQWQGAYANNKKPKPDESKLTADTRSDPPPKADCVGGARDCPSWYASGAPYVYAPLANATGNIGIDDSPSPGWPNRNPKDRTQSLREAHATWQFETYLCVRSSDAPAVFFRRAIATWQVEVTFNDPNTATAKVTPALTQMTPDISPDPAKCPVGGMAVNYWLNHVVTFK